MKLKSRLAAVLAAVAIAVAAAGCSAQTEPATNVTATSATLHGKFTTNGSEAAGDWWYEYSDNGSTWSQSVHHPWGGGPGSCQYSTYPESAPNDLASETIPGLTPSTHYVFRVAGWVCNVGSPTNPVRLDKDGTGNGNWDAFDTLAAPPPAGDRFVSTTGSDSNPGTSAAPWRHFGYAIDHVAPGQVLTVRGGTYVENVQEIVTPGTATSPVTVRAAAGENPVIQGKLWAEAADYWTFDNIDVTWGFTGLSNGDQMTRIIRSHDWRYTNSELWNAHSTAQMGIQAGYNFLIDHNYMHDTVPSNQLNQDHVIYASTEGGHGVGGTGIIERNILAESPNGRGIKINGDGLTVRFNTMVDNLGPSNIQLSDDADDNRIFRNILVHSNARNITRFNLAGTNNVAFENIGWQSDGVVDAGTGLTDGGGNLFRDPQLVNFVPQDPTSKAYGHTAP